MYHAKEKLVMGGSPPRIRPEWTYVNDSDRAAMLLVRLVVGKVVDRRRLENIFRHVPLRTEDPDWNCVLWMEDAFNSIIQDGHAVATTIRDWSAISDRAMRYVAEKKNAHRFDGKDATFVFDPQKPATWDMLKDEEMNL